MDKNIIINGVDVAGCAYMLNNKIQGKQHGPAKAMPYAKETSCVCRKSIDTPYNFCKHNPNCQYKQLKRLEQENKELKEKIIELSEEKGHLIVENNTLKESNQSLSMLGTDLVSANETVRKEFFRADKNKDMWREKAENYRSALEEILESAKFAQCLPCGSGNLEDCLNCDDDTTNNGQFCMEKRIHEIKTKCVEVLGE